MNLKERIYESQKEDNKEDILRLFSRIDNFDAEVSRN